MCEGRFFKIRIFFAFLTLEDRCFSATGKFIIIWFECACIIRVEVVAPITFNFKFLHVNLLSLIVFVSAGHWQDTKFGFTVIHLSILLGDIFMHQIIKYIFF